MNALLGRKIVYDQNVTEPHFWNDKPNEMGFKLFTLDGASKHCRDNHDPTQHVPTSYSRVR